MGLGAVGTLANASTFFSLNTTDNYYFEHQQGNPIKEGKRMHY
jgi:hypothetical protein